MGFFRTCFSLSKCQIPKYFSSHLLRKRGDSFTEKKRVFEESPEIPEYPNSLFFKLWQKFWNCCGMMHPKSCLVDRRKHERSILKIVFRYGLSKKSRKKSGKRCRHSNLEKKPIKLEATIAMSAKRATDIETKSRFISFCHERIRILFIFTFRGVCANSDYSA